MILSKEKLLDETHDIFKQICFLDFPIEQVPEYVNREITGYGTNINEKILSIADFVDLLNLQREESVGIEMQFKDRVISKMPFANDNAAIFIDEIELLMNFDEGSIELKLRLSSVFEFDGQRWMAVHFHGSLAQGVEGDRDTWSVNEWKQKNEALEKLIKERTAELNASLENLKATQSQLVHSEKMASLGELTAGIAHEIQNPLNFVNNFSEVNSELIQELKAESQKPKAKRDEKLEEELLNDLEENEKKINFHGKRAEDIVKSMLQHSRTSAGEKELTDVNALCDEYLRLAYHGMRARDKSFNSEFRTDLDTNLPKINVVPQDIGRVLLNLINNAFQAVSQKLKRESDDYKPMVTVSTKRIPLQGGVRGGSKEVQIVVSDNGPGIPDEIKDKIFQPFFTTKPTGQGTGLGLSLSYDIVKAHGGELAVDTEEGEGTIFTITI